MNYDNSVAFVQIDNLQTSTFAKFLKILRNLLFFLKSRYDRQICRILDLALSISVFFLKFS